MPNTIPVNDSRSVTEFIATQAAEQGRVPVYPIGCVTKGQKGEELAEMGDMIEAGARAFSDDGKPVLSSLIMRKALEYSQIFDLPIIDHCEDPVLVDGGVMNEGNVSTRLGLRGWPGVAEDVMVERNIMLAEYTGGHVHIAHMSTGRSAELVREGKRRNVRVTCEVTPHHLVLTDEAVATYDTSAKMNPPLRNDEDRRALIEALADGTVDAIATDHAPHRGDEKCVEFALAPFGIVGLETAVGLAIDRLIHGKVIGIAQLVRLFSTGPAEVFNLPGGSLREGEPADLTLLDMRTRWTVDPAKFKSKACNTPFAGRQLKGAPVVTIVGGKIVWKSKS